jgi:predicted RNA-binding Zn-ribbon protein involved in translation (DUF1610 family)
MSKKQGVRIPKKDAVKFIIKDILKKNSIDSQRQLADLVNKKLKMVEADYSITGKRARFIALEIPKVKLAIETRHGKMPEKCPSCGHGLKKSYMRNLKGKKILFEIKCIKCGYKGHEGSWIPRKYEFMLSKH